MNNRQNRLPEDMIIDGKIIPVTVVAVTGSGVIVQVDNTEYTAFIHISKIANDYVKDVNDYISIGDKFSAKGIRSGAKPELILSHLDLKPVYKKAEPKKEYKPKQPIQPAPEQFTSTQHIPKSLDDMIADANRSYKDKFSSKDKGLQKPRKRFYRKNNNNS